MKMKHLFIVMLLMTAVGNLFAQPENAKTEVRNGQTFYVHEVIQGNTLWGLQNAYKVSAEIIIQHNPNAAEGLKVGQLIYIPTGGNEPVKTNASAHPQAGTHVVENVVHVVAAGETVYGISRKYNITPEQLLELNPEAKSGLSIGQVLLISKGKPSVQNNSNNTQNTTIPETPREPSTVVLFKDSLVQHRVMKGETLYSIAKRFMVPVETLMEVNKLKNQSIKEGDILVIPLKKEAVEQVPYRQVPPPIPGITVNAPSQRIDENFQFQKKNNLRVAVLLPIEYGKSTRNNGKTRAAIQFYAGVKMALDTLGKMGLNAEVTLFDTKSDSATTVDVLQRMNDSQWDLIIGPLFHTPAQLVANWAKHNRVPLLLPTPMSPSLLKMNPYVYMAIPTDKRIMEGMAEHIVQRHAKDNIILIKSGLAEDEQNYESLKNKINSLLGVGAYRQAVKEISGKGNLQGAFVKGVRNVFILPSKNKNHVTDFWKAFLSFQLRNSDGNNPNIVLYGMREWEEWKEITRDQKSMVNFHYASATSWITTSGGFTNFSRQYRARFMAEPERLTVQGYDATQHFIRNYFMKNLTNYNAIINQFNYQSTGEGHGMENKTVFILRYEENKLKELNRVQ
jgi:LysM repeat protein